MTWKQIKILLGIAGWVVAGCLSYFLISYLRIGSTSDKKAGLIMKKAAKALEAKSEELSKMAAADVVDTVDVDGSVRESIDRGRNRFADRVRSMLEDSGGGVDIGDSGPG